MHKEDHGTASTSVLPCSLIIIEHLFQMDLEGADVHTRDVNVIAFFFLNRPGEVVKTSTKDKGCSTPFTLAEVASCPSLCGLTPSLPSDTILPTNAAATTKRRDPTSTQPWSPASSGRRSAAEVQHCTGIPPRKISARSLRPGGATALLCSDVQPENIALVGRWCSDAMLQYLRANTTPVTQGLAQKMVANGSFTYNGTAAIPGGNPEEEIPGIPDQVRHLAVRNLFDPTDDASDNEEEPDNTPPPLPGRRR